MTAIGGATHVAAVVGDPITHSLSPAIHNAAFEALGLDWVFLAFAVPAGSAAPAVEAMRTFGLAGLSVTMPHKAGVIPALDGLSPTAETLGAVNTIYRRGRDLIGDSTDGAGFLDALRHDEGFDPAGKRCVVLGAGGAARAVVHALGGAGAADVAVVNRTAANAERAAALASVGRLGTEADVDGADLIVNATPVGMAGVEGDSFLVDPARLGPGQVVADLVYHPIRTPLLHAARQRGAIAVTGLGMLIHQAAHAFRLWTGEDPPLEAMSAVALAALAGRE
ncbi:MAG: shikimate dehydrogenase [Actinomycetota bacterium]|nr:shikimate dehydrogenase [Actinomycetota bacterium]